MIKVFVIDDSMLVRNIVKKLLRDEEGINIIGEASNPVDAMEEFKKVGLPDVFILDIEMPKMDGLTFLKQLKEQRPIPTVIFATMSDNRSSKAIEAMELGACDIIVKPNNIKMTDVKEEFLLKIKAAANSKNIEIKKNPGQKTQKIQKNSDKIIAIGASTGGVQTIEHLLVHLAPNHPPIVITQHMPAGFTASFAKRLDKVCDNSNVYEAKGNEVLQSGSIYIAPGDMHLEVERVELHKYKTVLKDYPKVSNHKPSVDVLFKSVSKEVKNHAVAFILTGMGKDGASGIKKIKESGGLTYGQDEESSIVYGMPKVAYDMGGVSSQASLEEIIEIINNIN